RLGRGLPVHRQQPELQPGLRPALDRRLVFPAFQLHGSLRCQRQHRVLPGPVSLRFSGILAAVFLACTPLAAQTNDHFFRSWRWVEEPSSPRAAGLAGAMTALGDDGAAALHNPAGLPNLTKSEVAGGLIARGDGTNSRGDTLVARTSVGSALAAIRLRQRWVIAGYVAETQASRIKLDASRLADGFTDTGSVEGVATELGAAAASQLSSPLQLGGRIGLARLALDADYNREPTTGPTNLRVTSNGEATRPTGAIGAVLVPVPWLRLGASASEGVSWRLARRATSPV